MLLLKKNKSSIFAPTHHERSFDHVGKDKHLQAEAGFIILGAQRGETIRLSAQSPRYVGVPHTYVCGQSIPAGAQSNPFITQLNIVIKNVTQEMALDEG
jgi:hypothetical protein